MAFDVEGAKAAGYSEAEIAEYLAASKTANKPAADSGPAYLGGGSSATFADELRTMLEPAPNTTYGNAPWLPIARDNTTGELRPAMPTMVRTALRGAVDLLQGPGGMMVDTAGNTKITPEATETLMMLPAPVSPAAGTGRAVAAATGQRVMQREAPLSPEFRVAPTVQETPGRVGATMEPGPVSPNPNLPPGPPPSRNAIFPLEATPTAPPAPRAVPKTSDEAKSIAGEFYTKADQVGGGLTPEFTNRFIDTVSKVAPQTEEGLAVAGATPATTLVERIGAIRDKPISLKGAQEIDEALGGLIDKEYGIKGLSKAGQALLDLQSTFRNMISDADETMITGGRAGFDAIVQGRKAWAQAMKMRDLERIQERAALTDNPATSIKSGLRVLLSNPTRVRGYSDEEVAALKAAAERGVIGSGLHVFGSRLLPLAAGVATGGLEGLIVAGAVHAGTSVARRAAQGLQAHRLGNALTQIGHGVPGVPPPMVAPQPSLLPGAVAAAAEAEAARRNQLLQ